MVCVQAYMGVRTLGVLRKNYLLRAYMGFARCRHESLLTLILLFFSGHLQGVQGGFGLLMWKNYLLRVRESAGHCRLHYFTLHKRKEHS